MSEKLKPCPFCGVVPKPHIFEWGINGYITLIACDSEDCPVSISVSASDNNYPATREGSLSRATKLWNTRYVDSGSD